MRAGLNGVTLAESDATVVVEGNHYFPSSSVEWEHFDQRRLRTLCPWKGVARYYDVTAGGEVAKAVAWSYHHPYPWIRKIRRYVAFADPVEVG